MTREENIRAILECYFTGFKEEIIDGACDRICDLEQKPYICDTCEHKDDSWDTEPCDGCCGAHSGYEPTDAISRDAVWGIIMRSDFVDRFTYQEFTRKLDALPNFPVTPQKPCEDAISRQAVISTIYDNKSDFKNDFAQGFFADKIRDLPSVTQKSGKWIKKEDDTCWWYVCSECGQEPLKNRWNDDDELSTFCPICGARMESEQNE